MTNNLQNDITVRKFSNKDRATVRKISCDTAFLGKPAAIFFDGDEILADALTLYFTDYEPETCFVAAKGSRVIGYLLGTKNTAIMKNTFTLKILPRLFLKSIRKGIFFRRKNIRFFIYCTVSLFRGEFFMPDFTRQYPAALHINIDNNFRGLNIGKRLMEAYLSFLKQTSVPGVHCSTVSEGAREFFIKQGFSLLFTSGLSYWNRYSGRTLPFYILGKKCTSSQNQNHRVHREKL